MFLEHVNLSVTDIDRSRDFYCSLLGFKVRWEGKVNAQSGGLKRAVHVGNDRVYLALFEAEQPGRAPWNYGAAGMNHFGFVVPNLEEVEARVKSLGVTPHLEGSYDPGRRIYVQDPDGIEIELVEYQEG